MKLWTSENYAVPTFWVIRKSRELWKSEIIMNHKNWQKLYFNIIFITITHSIYCSFKNKQYHIQFSILYYFQISILYCFSDKCASKDFILCCFGFSSSIILIPGATHWIFIKEKAIVWILYWTCHQNQCQTRPLWNFSMFLGRPVCDLEKSK